MLLCRSSLYTTQNKTLKRPIAGFLVNCKMKCTSGLTGK